MNSDIKIEKTLVIEPITILDSLEEEISKYYYRRIKRFNYALYLTRQGKYTPKSIPKKSGGERLLMIPDKNIRFVQKEIADILVKYLLEKRFLSRASFAFTPLGEQSLGISLNAAKHVKKLCVINVDLENFFDSINFGRVLGLLRNPPYSLPDHFAVKLAQLSIYDNKLPQGSPLSPVLSNMIATALDKKMILFAKEKHATYSRYADDLTLSFTDSTHDNEQIVEDIKRIVEEQGFKVNEKKIRSQFRCERQIVTGLKVNKKINLDRRFIRNLRSMLFTWYKNGIESAADQHFRSRNRSKYRGSDDQKIFKKIIQGKLSFMKQVLSKESRIFKRYFIQFCLLEYGYVPNRYNEQFNLEYIPDEHNKRIARGNEELLNLAPPFDSVIVHVEGRTDSMYLKAALDSFRKKGEYLDLKILVYPHGGESNLLNYINEHRKKKKQPDSRHKFIIDSDCVSKKGNWPQSLGDYCNYIYFIEQEKQKYIEYLLEDDVKKIIEDYGYKYDRNAQFWKDKKNDAASKIAENMESLISYNEASVIFWKGKSLSKIKIAEKILEKQGKVNFDRFKSIFEFLS